MTKEELRQDIIQRIVYAHDNMSEYARERTAKDFQAVVTILTYSEGTEEDFNELLNPFEHYDASMARSVNYMRSKLCLNTFSDMKKWFDTVNKYAGYMLSCTYGNISDEEFAKLTALKEENFRYPMNGRLTYTLLAVIIRFMNQFHDFDFDGNTRTYLEMIHFRNIRLLFRDMISVLSEYKPKETNDSTVESDKALTLTLNDLRSALNHEKSRSEKYRRELETLRTDAEKNALLRIFRRMNSNEMENMLDQFALSYENLNALRAEGFDIPHQMNSCAMCVDMFMRALNEFGIEHTLNVGETLSINLEESEKYDYTGSDFEDDEERKKVQVSAPGWTYDETIISLPKVYECH